MDNKVTKTKTLPFRLKKKRRILYLSLLLLCGIALLLEKNLEGVILSMAEARVRAMAVDILNESVKEVMSGEDAYGALVNVRTDGDGRVTMVQADAMRMNDLATRTALTAQQALGSAECESVLIPLGAALGIPFLSATGPAVGVRVVPVGAVSAAFTSEFESAGINQTRHKIFLSMKTNVRLVLPTGAERVEFTSQVLIAESIIVGQVPDSFIEVRDVDDALNLSP